MPCCAGVEGGCATGACQDALFKGRKKEEEPKEKLCGSEAAFKSHAASKKRRKTSRDRAHDTADHSDSEKDNSVKGGAKATAALTQQASTPGKAGAVYARAIAAPCAKDCCAAASPSTQSRRGRDSALATPSGKSPPTDFASLSLYLLKLEPGSSAHLKRLKARAPPRIPSSSQA